MIREDLAMVMRDVCKLVDAGTAARKVESESDIDAVPWLDCDVRSAVLSPWLCRIWTLNPEVAFMFASG